MRKMNKKMINGMSVLKIWEKHVKVGLNRVESRMESRLKSS